MEHLAGNKPRMTFTDQIRQLSKGLIDPAAVFLNAIGFTPNTITFIGLIGNVAGGVLVALGHLTIGGLVILLLAPMDALDGSLARLKGENRTDSSSTFGAFLDSVTDRYSELAVFAGLLIYCTVQGNDLGAGLAYAAAAGSIMVSYTRARAQSLGVETKIGLLTRLERYLVLIPSLVFNLPMLGLWILAIFTNITAVQRIWDVRRQMELRKHTD